MTTQSELMALLHYEPMTGIFTWLVDRGRRYIAGQRAGSIQTGGYRRIGIGGRLYAEHRLAWLYVHGTWPSEDIDHNNRDTTDNRIANLRLATDSQNLANAKLQHNNKSGVKGIYWDPLRDLWRVRIGSNCRKGNYIGHYDNLVEAIVARRIAVEARYGPFAA
jgi:hypothetical protein